MCGPSTAIGHIPPRERRASRRLHSGDLVLSRGSPYQVCSVSVGVIRWTGTPCQMVPRLQVVRIARFIVAWVQQGCTLHIFCFVPGCTPLPYPSQIRVNGSIHPSINDRSIDPWISADPSMIDPSIHDPYIDPWMNILIHGSSVYHRRHII